MKKFSLMSLVFSCLLLFYSCTEEKSVAPTESSNVTLLKSSGPSVNGQATVDLGGGSIQIFEFHAREKDGVVIGSVQVNAKYAGVIAHGIVDCMKIINGNEAILCGYYNNVVKWGPIPQGQYYFWLHVVDNGEGKGSTDEFIDYFNTSPYSCDDNPSGGNTFSVINGNVQVKP